MVPQFLQKFAGHPILLVIATGLLSGSVILGYRNIAQPYFARQRRIQAELMADYLFEKEIRKE